MSDELRNMFKNLQGNKTMILINAKVKSIDKEKCFCECMPIGGTVEMVRVRLKSIIKDDTGLVIFPEKDSVVLLGMIENRKETACVLLYDKIESYKLSIGDNYNHDIDNDGNVKINAKSIVYNDGNNNGLVKLKELEDNLNVIKNYLDVLKNATSAGIKAVGLGTGASGTNGATAFDGVMASQVINFENMENKDIKH